MSGVMSTIDRLAMRDWIDTLPPASPICWDEWLLSIEGRPQVAAVADDWWRMICDHVSRGSTVAEAASDTFQLICGYYGLVGIGDLRYLGAIGLIENHMPDGCEVRVWHTQTFGV